MKVFTLFLFLLLVFCAGEAFSQVKIGDNPTNVNPNSLLELESTTKGLLLPRLSNEQINAMTNVPVGMLLFSTTDSALYLRKDTGWAILGLKPSPVATQWASNGADIYNTNGGNVGIGTSTPSEKFTIKRNGRGVNQESLDGAVKVGFYTNDYSAYVQTHTNVPLYFATNDGLADMALTTDGNVGIGTTTPAARLQVSDGGLMLDKGATINEFSTDSTFSAGSDQKVPTEKAIKGYVQGGKFISGSSAATGGSLIAPGGFTDQNLNIPFSVAVQGNYAYVASAGNDRLCIYDISNPNAPVAKGFTSTNLFTPYFVAVQGNYAYVTCRNNNRLCIFDISNPDNPFAKGYTSANLNFPQSVAVQGNYAYVASKYNSLLCVFDVSNPAAPVAKGTINTNLSLPYAVAVQGAYAYVTCTGNNQLCIYDVSNPTSLVAKGVNSSNLNTPVAVAVQGSYAYVSSGNNSLICTFDVSDPNLPVAKATTGQNLASPYGIAVQGKYAYVASRANNQVCVYDISDPNAIVFKAIAGQSLDFPFAVAVQGNYAYITSNGSANRLSVFNYTLAPAIPVPGSSGLTYSNTLADYTTTANLGGYAVTLSGDQTIDGVKTFNSTSIFNGNTGFGTATPGGNAKVEINGGTMRAISANYRFMNSTYDGQHYGTGSNYSYSLYTSGRIWCGDEVDVTSDERTKTNIASSGPLHDLQLIGRLHVVDYNYKDKVSKGNRNIKGFLAQEVEKVMPDAVTKNTGVLPNIYQNATSVAYDAASQTLALTLPRAAAVKTGDTVKLITDNGDEYARVAAVNGNRFTIAGWHHATDWAFVYGTLVHDMRNLDYNKIFSAGIGAIQQLSKDNRSLKKENDQMKKQLQSLAAKVSGMEQRIR